MPKKKATPKKKPGISKSTRGAMDRMRPSTTIEGQSNPNLPGFDKAIRDTNLGKVQRRKGGGLLPAPKPVKNPKLPPIGKPLRKSRRARK